MKIITGTKMRRKQQKQERKGDALVQLRCQKCGEMAVKSPDGKGGYICKCPYCKTEYRFSLM